MEIPAIVGGGLVVIGAGIGIGRIGVRHWKQWRGNRLNW